MCDAERGELRRISPVQRGMKNTPKNDDGRDERSGKPVTGKPESAESQETFAQREIRPGDAGLANEVRPGLGTRAEDEETRNDPGAASGGKAKRDKFAGAPKATRYGYHEPRPEPREQAPDSMAHELERSTSVSGQTGSG